MLRLTFKSILFASSSLVLGCKVSGHKQMVSNPAMDGTFEGNATYFPLSMTVTCQITCRMEKPETTAVTSVYDPKERGLVPGNGGFLGSLSHDLSDFAEQICLSQAGNKCGELNKIESLITKSMQSGDWHVALPILCQSTHDLLSPFEGTVKSEQALAFKAPKAFIPSQPDPKAAPRGPCVDEISSTLCFGDCLTKQQDGAWLETIATTEPQATKKINVCGDHLKAFIQKNGITASTVKEHLCHHYFWLSQKKKGPNVMTSCAALRADIDCSRM